MVRHSSSTRYLLLQVSISSFMFLCSSTFYVIGQPVLTTGVANCGDDVKLTCSQPDFDVTASRFWKKGAVIISDKGQDLSGTDRYSEKSTSNDFSLVISNAILADADDYTCGYQFVPSSAKSLSFECKPVESSVDITRNNQNKFFIQINNIYPSTATIAVTCALKQGKLSEVIKGTPGTASQNGDHFDIMWTSDDTISAETYNCAITVVTRTSTEIVKNETFYADCGPLPSPASGSVATPSGTTMDMDAEYTCITGYFLTGNPIRTCQADGQWAGTEPSCNRIVCGGLTDPDYGHADTSAGLEFENEAIYQCDSGYVLTGQSSRWCKSDGEWTGTEPGCSPIDCGPLEEPCNGTVSTPDGTILYRRANYSCETGFTLVGDDERHCLPTGKWSHNKPCCVRMLVDCGSPSAPANGTVSTPDGTLLDNQAVYKCDGEAHVVGESTRTCLWNGVWSGMEPQCKICPDPFEYFFDETSTCYFVANGTNAAGFRFAIARQQCFDIGGKLVEVKTAPEHKFLVGVLNSLRAGSATDYWIGGIERRKRNWVFDYSSTNINRFFWAKGYPKCTRGRTCLEMCGGCSNKKYSWRNSECVNEKQYICETPPI